MAEVGSEDAELTTESSCGIMEPGGAVQSSGKEGRFGWDKPSKQGEQSARLQQTHLCQHGAPGLGWRTGCHTDKFPKAGEEAAEG